MGLTEFKTIATVDDLIGQEGKQVAFLPTGEVTYRNGVTTGMEVYFIRECQLLPSSERVIFKIHSEEMGEVVATYPRGYRWPMPMGLEAVPSEKFVTYKRADGEMIWGNYGWVADLEFFDDEAEDLAGVKIIAEEWVLVKREEIHLHPEDCYICERPWHAETCDQEPEENP